MTMRTTMLMGSSNSLVGGASCWTHLNEGLTKLYKKRKGHSTNCQINSNSIKINTLHTLRIVVVFLYIKAVAILGILFSK